MPRRASSPGHPLILLVVLLLLAGALGGGFYLYRVVSDPFRTLTPLEVASYMESSNSLRGNTYRILGTVGNKLAWSAEKGSLYSIDVETGDKSDPLPLMVPKEFAKLNIQKGQRYFVRVEVDDSGLLVAKELKKA